jgi:Protein kinase domain/Putative zinc-finger
MSEPARDDGGACPDDDALIAVVEHALDPDAMAAIEAHVDACARCRATVGHLAALDDGDGSRRLGRYRLERLLGQGGMGVVWRAWDPMLERGVAIKLLRGDGSAHGPARLLREARALARLQHPNVVAVHDVGELDGEVFVATELVDGLPMHRWQHGRDPREIVRAYAQAARGLAAAHALGLVHRDVKPANILVGHDGRVRVGDFGLVTTYDHGVTHDDGGGIDPAALDTPLTETGAIVGTPAYMAPEQRAGHAATAHADQFSLCLALAEALLDVRPPPDTSAAAMAAATPRRAPWAAIARGLARDPARRFADIGALADALEAGDDPAPPAPRDRRRWILGASLAVAVIAGASVWGALGASGAATAPRASADPARDAARAVMDHHRAAEQHDAAACFAAAERLETLAGDLGSPIERGTCEMIAGRCGDGTARITRFFVDRGAPASNVDLYVRLWCPIEGDLATRLERAWTQVAAHQEIAYCDAIAPAVRAVAAEVGARVKARYDDASNQQRERAAEAIGNLARCDAIAHRCADAAVLWREETGVRGLDVGHAPCQ